MTRCISAREPNDADLLRVLDGEDAGHAAKHVRECSHCRQRAIRLAKLHDRLTTRLYRLDCPTPDRLGEYHMGLATKIQAETVAQHLAQCPHCEREVAQLASFLDELAPELEPSFLERTREQATALIAKLVPGPDRDRQQQMPGWAPARAGIRGSDAGPLLYQAGDLTISIDIQPDGGHPGRYVILGLVMGLHDAPASVGLVEQDLQIAEQAIDEAASFAFPKVASGDYGLRLVAEHVQVHIKELKVGGRF